MRDPKEACKQIVERVAPDEAALFAEVWQDFKADPEGFDEDTRVASAHRLNAADLAPIVSAVVIPLVVALASHVTKRTVDEVWELVKKRLAARKASGIDARKLAEVIVEELDKTG